MGETAQEVFEFRGVDNLVYAEVLTDTDSPEGYTTGEVKMLAPVAEIGKTTETSSEAKYYDNKPMLTVDSEGSDTVTITCAPLTLETQADVTGKTFDPETGMMIDGERTKKYFAVGYRTKGTDGKYRYVWRLKGSFGIPDETNATENEGTDTNNMQLTYTGISTTHKFEKDGKSAKAVVVDERYGKTDLSTFFNTVQTPDTVTPKSSVEEMSVASAKSTNKNVSELDTKK